MIIRLSPRGPASVPRVSLTLPTGGKTCRMRGMARAALAFALLLAVGIGASVLRADEAWMYDPTFREGRPSDVLHDGPPPLLRSVLDGYVDLVEGSFDLALTKAQEVALRDALESSYEALDEKGRRDLLALVLPLSGARRAARSGNRATLAKASAGFLRALDTGMTAAPDTAAHKVIREALAAKLEVAWAGAPPITGTAAGAWLALVECLVSLGRNEDYRATTGQQDVLRRELATAFLALPAAERQRLKDAHRTWLRFQAAWDRADLAKRIGLRWKAMGLLARLLPSEKRITVDKTGDLKAYARAAALLRPTQSAYAAWSNAAAHPKQVLALVEAWLGPIDPQLDHILLYR